MAFTAPGGTCWEVSTLGVWDRDLWPCRLQRIWRWRRLDNLTHTVF